MGERRKPTIHISIHLPIYPLQSTPPTRTTKLINTPTNLGEQRFGDPEVVRGVLQPRVERGGGGRGGALRPGGAEEDEEAFLLLDGGWWLVGRGRASERGWVGRSRAYAHT